VVVIIAGYVPVIGRAETSERRHHDSPSLVGNQICGLTAALMGGSVVSAESQEAKDIWMPTTVLDWMRLGAVTGARRSEQPELRWPAQRAGVTSPVSQIAYQCNAATCSL
jgi:hypothetical protein